MKYTVKYKRGLFWKTLKNVTGDGYVDGGKVRFFILESGEVIEMDTTRMKFVFSKEREEAIKLSKQENGKTI